MSDKTLVERLRDLQHGDCAYITQCNLARAVGVRHCRENELYGCNVCLNKTIKEIADEIEYEYLPREILDANGVPIHKGDTVWHVGSRRKYTVVSLPKNRNQYEAVGVMTEDCVTDYYDPPMLTHKQPVLDANGVPIKVGDTVYFRLNAEPLRVTKIDDGGWIICEGERNHIFPHPDEDLTHKRPDSLERIEADARKNPYDYWGCGGASCLNCPAKKDGKEPRERYGTHSCNQAMKLDLLRRQREVLERGR